MSKELQKYIKKLCSLRQGNTQYGPAPHKPVLLLAVIAGFEQGLIVGNCIKLSPELVGLFRSIWQSAGVVGFDPLIAQPFFHLRGEKFWQLVVYPGYENWGRVTKQCKSIGVLRQTVEYARLDDELFKLIIDPVKRDVLRQALIERYFPQSLSALVCGKYDGYFDFLGEKMVSEKPEEYRAEVEALMMNMPKESYEEEVYVRSGIFKRKVPQIYHNTCCISGLKVETTLSASMIDACHIVPFSESHDDTISNGLALCPTLHRAFDRGLIAIDPDSYQVKVSNQFVESTESVYSIKQFDHRKIILPREKRFWPSGDNLQTHLDRFAVNF